MTAHPAGRQAHGDDQHEEGHHQTRHPRRARPRARGFPRAAHVTGARRGAQPQRYEIRVRGRLGEIICSAFPDLRARADGGDTVLAGVLADQAALYGVLAEIEALGLELVEVRRVSGA